MKFLIDQQLPPGLAVWLGERGFEAQHVREVGLRDAEDREIWAHAVRERFVIVTKDEDFPQRRARLEGPVIVWLRLGNATNRQLFAWLAPRWAGIVESIEEAAGVVEVR